MKYLTFITVHLLLFACTENVVTIEDSNCFSEQNENSVTFSNFKGQNIKLYVNESLCIDQVYDTDPSDSSGFSGHKNLVFKNGDTIKIFLDNAKIKTFRIKDNQEFIIISYTINYDDNGSKIKKNDDIQVEFYKQFTPLD